MEPRIVYCVYYIYLVLQLYSFLFPLNLRGLVGINVGFSPYVALMILYKICYNRRYHLINYIYFSYIYLIIFYHSTIRWTIFDCEFSRYFKFDICRLLVLLSRVFSLRKEQVKLNLFSSKNRDFLILVRSLVFFPIKFLFHTFLIKLQFWFLVT